jgi:hypothetical protein
MFLDDQLTDERCKGCGAQLTVAEVEMYDGICNFCATVEWDRLIAWRDGGEDHELDARYSDMKRRRLN